MIADDSQTGCRCMETIGGMNRRELLQSSFAMTGATALCCTTPDIPPGAITIQDQSLIVNLEQAPALNKPGAAAKLVDVERSINLIIVQPEKDRFAALDRSCTHGGAQVSYNRHRSTVQCTNWGHSEFALDGEVLGGSARQPLRTYRVRREGNRLEILLGDKP